MMLSRRTELFRSLAERLARPMVVLSFLFIVLLAAALHRVMGPVPGGPETGAGLPDLRLFLLAFALLWPLFVIEAVVQYLALEEARRCPRRLASGLVVALCPPLRLGARCPVREDQLWLPGLGWQEVDSRLRHRLERLFSVPMILIALLILPVLVIEYRWSEWALRHPSLGLLLGLCTAVIWLAFTVEFILMCSIATDRLAYCRRHWLDLAIILLPLVAFLRFARVGRLGRLVRLKQLGALGRIYRLRGLALRAHRGIITLDLLDRLLRRPAEKRLEHLRADLAAREAEVQALRRKIAALETQIAPQAEPETSRGGMEDETAEGRARTATGQRG